jgi:hypothetical protein
MDLQNQLKFLGIDHVESMFHTFRCNLMAHLEKRRHRIGYIGESTKFGQFLFLMRAVLIRHSHNQQYRGSSTTLMSLPPKVISEAVL